MIHIMKGRPPTKYLTYQKTVGATFDDMPTDTKGNLRAALLAEQGYLCAYCMQQIGDTGNETKIEHYQPRNPKNELIYTNLLAVCHGGEGHPAKEQTCDTRKAQRKLQFNPQRLLDIDTLYYQHTGRILSTNFAFQQELDQVLNLNQPEGYLIVNRRSVLAQFIGRLQTRLLSSKADAAKKRAEIRKWLSFYQEKHEGKYRPYCGIIIWYLQDRMSRMKQT